MEKKKSCFVIIGYGKKTSFANGKVRVLDLDETFSLLIKPVFDALDIDCYRAIDKNLNGSIDKVMLQEIKNADIALVDISTLNANVMWELGVRHAMKPNHTIMISEKEQMSSIPFDVNHFVIYQYAHSEEGIPFREVERFRQQLTKIVSGLLELKTPPTDSPVFTFLEEELKKDKAQSTNGEGSSDSFATIMSKAEKARKRKDFAAALALLDVAKGFALENMTLKSSLNTIITQQALCTYQLKEPNPKQALLDALTILEELQPQQSADIEVLGLSGAIHKRLFELDNNTENLDFAIQFYSKGFQIKHDYYNGINAVFMLYTKARLFDHDSEEWEDLKIHADHIRNNVLSAVLKLEKESTFLESKDALWILLTAAEAYNYKKNEAKMLEYEQKANDLAIKLNDNFAMSSYQSQKDKIAKLNF